MELDGLYVPARAPWLPDLKAELLAFPRGKHDDIVDALGLVGQLLDKWAPGGVPKIDPSFFRLPPIDYVALYPRPDELLSLKVLLGWPRGRGAPSRQTEWAPSRRADQGRDCRAAEIQRIAQNAPRRAGMNRKIGRLRMHH
jgi:hypothetical protein